MNAHKKPTTAFLTTQVTFHILQPFQNIFGSLKEETDHIYLAVMDQTLKYAIYIT